MRQQLSLGQEGFKKLILAQVIGGHVSSLERHFLINKGEKEGVVKSTPAARAETFQVPTLEVSLKRKK